MLALFIAVVIALFTCTPKRDRSHPTPETQWYTLSYIYWCANNNVCCSQLTEYATQTRVNRLIMDPVLWAKYNISDNTECTEKPDNQ